ncbi:MAG TPA: RES family NAD+ phosphorylase [Candidatus Anammoximicrobium sp.]|nr:RES family NAD+ phosphorylase [Candidatus Anammoximicrobium sp.]
MPKKDPPQVVELFCQIAELVPRAITLNEIIVRSTGTRYANEEDFLSGRGAARHGGRWNRPGLRAVYASLDVITATYEAYQNFLDYGFALSAIRPRVTAGALAKRGTVLDLTDSAIRRKIGFTLTELLDEDWEAIQVRGEESWTQAIGRGSRQAGFEAILVPSARHRGGRNIVIFPDGLAPGSSLALLAPRDLPPHPSDWPS